MGANVPVYCRVLKTHEEWVEISAVTLDDAREEAEHIPGVIRVLETTYECNE
jgi:hypothetical protein